MIDRPFWRQRIEDAWREAPIAWLSGVRRCGKTTLAESLGADRILYISIATCQRSKIWCAIPRSSIAPAPRQSLTLEHLQAYWPNTPVRHWRDKVGRELDFVVATGRDEVDAIECKWNPDAFDAAALAVFRGYYPRGRNYLATPSGNPAYTRRYGDLEVRICTPTELEEI